MSVYISNLYEHIIKQNAPIYDILKVISGYASATFLERVANDFPHLKIEIYIGMAQQGVQYLEHVRFRDIVSKYPNINVYYQVSGVNNHMKLMVFQSQDDTIFKSYIGSANFTQNGFLSNQEIMVEYQECFKEIFEYQSLLSTSCMSDDFKGLLFILEDSENQRDQSGKDKENVDDNFTDIEGGSSYAIMDRDTNPLPQNIKPPSHRDSNYLYEREFFVNLLYESELWSSRTINSWRENKEPVLDSTPLTYLDKLFPQNKEIIIYTDDGYKVLAELTGRFDKSLRFKNTDLYEYVRKRLGIQERRAIHKIDLEHYGVSYFTFKRISELEYILEFKGNR